MRHARPLVSATVVTDSVATHPPAGSIPPPAAHADPPGAPTTPLTAAVRLGRIALRATTALASHGAAVGHAAQDLVEILTRPHA